MKPSTFMKPTIVTTLLIFFNFNIELKAQCYSCGNGSGSVILNDLSSNTADADFSISAGFNVNLDGNAFNSFGFGSELQIEEENSFIIGWGGQRVFNANMDNTIVFNPLNVKNSAVIDYNLNVGNNLTTNNDLTVGHDGQVTRNFNIGNNLNVGNNLTVTKKSVLLGNVGIGTQNPNHKLQVIGNISTQNLFTTQKIGIGTTTPEASLDVKTTSSGGLLIETTTAHDVCPLPPCGYYSSPYAIKVMHNNVVSGPGYGLTESFRLNTNGSAAFANHLSVGSTSTPPTAMVDVNASNSYGLNVRTNHSNDYGYGITSKVGRDLTKALVVQNDDGNGTVTEPFYVYGNGDVNMANLSMSGDLSLNGKKYLDEGKGMILYDERLYLRGENDLNHFLGWFGNSDFAGDYPDGPVLAGFTGGILGTTNGGEKAVLQWHRSGKVAVNGSLFAEEIKILVDPLTQIPDYVFEPDYNRMSLDELELFVSTEKHLPGIPSAKEVKEEGHIDMGKMQLDLLEKVEELTLYIIDLNKKIEKLEAENKQLNK